MLGLGVDALWAAGLGAEEGVGALEGEVRTKVLGADFIISCEGFRSAALEDGSLVEQIGAVNDGERLTHIVVGDDDTDILVFQFCDDVLDVLHGDRVDTGKRLIEKDELGVDGKCTCNLATAALTTGKLDALALAHLMEVELIEKVLQTLQSLFLCELLGHLHHGHDVVLHGHVTEHGSLLRKVADTLLRTLEHRQLGDVLVIQVDLAGIRNDEAGDHVETGGLSRSIRTEEAHDLALLHLHGNTLHHSPGAIFLD